MMKGQSILPRKGRLKGREKVARICSAPERGRMERSRLRSRSILGNVTSGSLEEDGGKKIGVRMIGKDGKKQTSQPKYSGKCNQWESGGGWWEEDWCEDDWEETSSWRGDEWWEDGWKNNWDWNTDGWKGSKGKGGRWSPREDSNWSGTSPKPSSRSDRQASGSPTPATSSRRIASIIQTVIIVIGMVAIGIIVERAGIRTRVKAKVAIGGQIAIKVFHTDTEVPKYRHR